MKEIEVSLPESCSRKFSYMCALLGMTLEDGVRFILKNGVDSFLSRFDRFYQQDK